MARARLSVRLPPETWVGETTRAHPGTEVRVHSVLPSDEGGVALAEVRADAPEAFLAAASRRRATASPSGSSRSTSSASAAPPRRRRRR